VKSPKRPSERERDLETGIVAEVPRLRGFLRRLAGGDAEDLLQETLERALRYASSFDESDGSLRSWLLKTAFRVFLDHRKRSARWPEALGDRAASMAAGRDADRIEDRDEVERLLAGLSRVERETILRFHRDGLSIPEIAGEAGMPIGTVKSHLHRARRKLARRARDGRDEEGA
jgi:RNA polymerase sigma-70 factor (ECF subfamily)